MKQYECVGCGRMLDSKNDVFTVASPNITENTSLYLSKYVCKECAAKIGITNFMSAGFITNIKVLKKLSEYGSPYRERYEEFMQGKNERKAERKELAKEEKKNKAREKRLEELKKQYTERHQDKYSCVSCGNQWFVGDEDYLKNFVNAIHFSLYSMNNVKEVDKCPSCGSRMIKKEQMTYWTDKKGNYVDLESILDSEN